MSEDGAARVVVGPQAVRDTVRIFVERLNPQDAPTAIAENAPLGRLWRFGPEGFRFERPVEVTLLVGEGELPPGLEVFPIALVTVGLDGRIEPLQDVRVVQLNMSGRQLLPAASSIRGLISHFSPFTKALVTLDVSNTDGFRDSGGVFQSSPDIFKIGDGGASRPNELAYQVIVTNRGSALTATNVQVHAVLAPTSGIIAFRSIVTGFPTRGVAFGFSATGFTWNVGSLGPGQSAEIQYRAEALRDGFDVNRITLLADQSLGVVTAEESTTVTGPSTPPIAINVSNEDGFRDAGGVFQSAEPSFRAGGVMAYQVIVTNRSPFAVTGVRVTGELAPTTRILRLNRVVPGFPTRGTTATSVNQFIWTVGTLGSGQSAELQFLVDAPQAGFDVHRATVTADQLPGAVRDDEPTTILP